MDSNRKVSTGAFGKLRHSKLSKTLVLISGVVLFSFLFISFFVSKQVRFEERLIVSAPFEILYHKLSNLEEWVSWTVWNDEYYQHQTDRRIEYVTDTSGKVIKSLEYEISTAEPATTQNSKPHPVLIIERTKVVTNQSSSSPAETEVEIHFLYSLWSSDQTTKSAETTRSGGYDIPPMLTAWSRISIVHLDNNEYEISWEYDGDYSPVMGSNPLQKYFLIFTEFSLQRAYRQSLQTLKQQLEKTQKLM